MPCQKIPLRFRRTAANRFSFPVLLNALEKHGLASFFEFRIADTFKALFTKTGQAPVIAYSFMTSHLPEVMRELAAIRRIEKNAILLAGGPHPTGDPEATLKMGFDFVFVGESENTFPEFCRIFGETGRAPEKRVWKADSPVSLDSSLPFSGMDPFLPPLEITRGCRSGCRFCQTRGHKPVHRSMESVEHFLDASAERNLMLRLGYICPSGFEYGADHGKQNAVEAIGRLLSISKSRGIRFLEYGIFPSEVRPNTVNADLLGLVKAYCSNRKITIGGQAGSNRLLKTVCRGHSVEDIEKAASLIRESGFKPQVDFILGFPGETGDDRSETLDLMKNLTRKYGAWNQVHYFLPLSGTPLYRSRPEPLDRASMRTLEAFNRGGICSDWWKKGVEQSGKVVRALEKIGKEVTSCELRVTG
jgi:B12-binding domain/radical SAM domain protein